jgi:succinate dehydrogenase / fumarate reductase flavoprotein subunit
MGREDKTMRVSRRDFLKFASIGAGAFASAGALGACASDAKGPAKGTQDAKGVATGAANAPQIEVINCDFLVIGAGNGAASVIEQALTEGMSVTVVDKGTYRHSGTSGLSWDCFALSIPDPKAIATYLSYQVNGIAMQNALDFDPEPNKFVYDINHGQSMPLRDDEGKLIPYVAPGRAEGQFFRRELDEIIEKRQATVYDRTMITDLFIDKGRCLGALGVHLPTGTFRVFRSPVTVAATGGCTWIYGWFTVGANTIGTADNTADVDMAAYRHGAGIGDSEYAQYDVLSCYPPGLAVGFGSGVCGDAQEAHAIYDKFGNNVFEEGDEKVTDRIYFNQQLGRVIVEEGRGTDNGGVYINVGSSKIRYSNERNIALLKEFGVDVRKEQIEAVPEMYEHGGNPVIDENMMTELKGFFHARGGGSAGENGGAKAHFNRIYGPYTAHKAVEYARQAPAPEDIDWTAVTTEYDRLQKIRTSNDGGGVLPHVIRQNIQKATKKGLGVYRSTALMEEAIAEFERIRAEELPRMSIRDASPTYNKEWKEAIEAYNMLDIAEMSVRASLLREETRGMYLRAEFPQKDDENWACMLVCRDNNGAMEFEKVALPKAGK